MRDAIVLAATIIVLAVVAASGVVLYSVSLQGMDKPLSKLEPVKCGSHTYLADPESLVMVYSIRLQAYKDGYKLEELYFKEVDAIRELNCTAGYAWIVNQTWSPTAGLSPQKSSIVLFGSNPAGLAYMIPESLLAALPNRAVAPGVYSAWHSKAGSAPGNSRNLTFGLFNVTVTYKEHELAAFDPVTGALTMRRLVYTAESGQDALAFVPDRIVRDMIVDRIYIETGPREFFDLKRIVDSLILLGLGAGALISAALIGAAALLAQEE